MPKNVLSADVEVWINGVQRTDAVLRNVASSINNKPEFAQFELLDLKDNDNRSIFEKFGNLRFSNHEVQIKLNSFWVHFGNIVEAEFDRSNSGEVLLFTSRFDNHLFGDPLIGAPLAADFEITKVLPVIGAEMILNPLYEGKIFPNQIVPDDSTPFEYATIMLPEQAIRLDEDLPGWDLAYAVHTLCEQLNPLEVHVKNPTFDHLQDVLPVEDEKLIQNVKFKIGSYLPEVLDALLIPLGFGWKVEHLSKTKRSIEVFQRGSGVKTQLQQNTVGTNTDSTDAGYQVNIRNDIASNTTNQVLVIGGRQQIEVTLELTPDWDATYEGRAPGYYQLGAGYWKNDPELAQVFRRWSLVPSNKNTDPRSDLAYSDQWQNIVGDDPFFTRRRFMPCITLRKDTLRPFGNFRGTHIEYRSEAADDPEWLSVEAAIDTPSLRGGQSVQLLDDELGIYFSGRLPPMLQQQVGRDEFRLRITATIETVGRRHVYSEELDEHELELFKILTLDMENSFPFRTIHEDSALKDRSDAVYPEIDSTEAMEAFAESILERQKHPETSGTITMSLIDPFQRSTLGKVLEKFQTMNFEFWNGSSYPTISGWSVDIDAQTTTISLGSK